jgi:hypothetical protein
MALCYTLRGVCGGFNNLFMNYLLQRFSDNRESTLGLLFKKILKGTETILHLQAYTLEDEHRDQKVSKETRIPAGTYELAFNKADTALTLKYRKKFPTFFKYHVEVKNVPGFVGVYLHLGNSDDDSAGCILLGDSAENNSIGAGNIMNSTAAFSRFYKDISTILEAGAKCTIEIRDEKALLT